ncbi:hypothetical protein WJX77_010445 [Trebouxia sp. C0004]
MLFKDFVQLMMVVYCCQHSGAQQGVCSWNAAHVARFQLSSHHLYHGNYCLPKQQPWSTVPRQLITSGAKSASVAELILFRQSSPSRGCKSWAVCTLQEQLSQQPQKVQCMPVCTLEERNEVHSWLLSKGVNAARVQQKAPVVMTREISAVQSTFEALQQAAAFSDKQICMLLHKHSLALAYGPEHVLSALQAVSTILGMPMTSDSFREVILAASDRLFCMSFRGCAPNQSSKASRTAGLGQLAPRWQLLSRLATDQAAFKAEDHLTTLAALLDQDFSDLFKAGRHLSKDATIPC